MTEAERIAERERQAFAWAICDMIQHAARDERASPAALALFAALRDRAPRSARRLFDDHGFSAITRPIAGRAEFAAAMKQASEEIASDMLAAMTQPAGAAGAGRRGARARSGINPAQILQSLSTGLKTALTGTASTGISS